MTRHRPSGEGAGTSLRAGRPAEDSDPLADRAAQDVMASGEGATGALRAAPLLRLSCLLQRLRLRRLPGGLFRCSRAAFLLRFSLAALAVVLLVGLLCVTASPGGTAWALEPPAPDVHPARAGAGVPARDGPEGKGSKKVKEGGADHAGRATPGRNWPVEGTDGARRPRVPRGWDPPPQRWAPGHRGVDLAARPGQAVRAVADGKVSFAGKVAGSGVVSIELAGTGKPPLRTTYQPVRPSVHKGEAVKAGETVGTLVRGEHCPHMPCLHWGLLRGDRYLDPLSLLPASLLGGRSRLLPVFGVPVPGVRRGQGQARGKDVTAAPLAAAPAAVAGPGAGQGGPATWSATAALVLCCLWAHRRLPGRRRPSRRRGCRDEGDGRHECCCRDGREREGHDRGQRGSRTVGASPVAADHRHTPAPEQPRQPQTPRNAMETAASAICSGSSAAPNSTRRTPASTTP